MHNIWNVEMKGLWSFNTQMKWQWMDWEVPGGFHRFPLLCIYFVITVGPIDLECLQPTTRAWLEFHRDCSSVETIASRRPLTLCNLSPWRLPDQISSHDGSRVLTGQAPVQKDFVLTQLCWHSIGQSCYNQAYSMWEGDTKSHGY